MRGVDSGWVLAADDLLVELLNRGPITCNENCSTYARALFGVCGSRESSIPSSKACARPSALVGSTWVVSGIEEATDTRVRQKTF